MATSAAAKSEHLTALLESKAQSSEEGQLKPHETTSPDIETKLAHVTLNPPKDETLENTQATDNYVNPNSSITESKAIIDDKPVQAKEANQGTSSSGSSVVMGDLFQDEDFPSLLEEWAQIRKDLYQAYDWRSETEEFERATFIRFTKFAKLHNDKAPQFEDFGACFEYVADKREEYRAIKEVRDSREERKAAAETIRKAKIAEEAAKENLRIEAERARQLVQQAKTEYEKSRRAVQSAEDNLAKREGRQIKRSPDNICRVCKTPWPAEVTRLSDCPGYAFHYQIITEQKQQRK